jgi:thioredoxin reductase
MGIELSQDHIRKPFYSETTQETNLPNVFLAGVICGGMNTHSLFIENSRARHAYYGYSEKAFIVDKPNTG